MARTTATLTLEIGYDPAKVDVNGLAAGMDLLIKNALKDEKLLGDYDDLEIGDFFLVTPPTGLTETISVEDIVIAHDDVDEDRALAS